MFYENTKFHTKLVDFPPTPSCEIRTVDRLHWINFHVPK